MATREMIEATIATAFSLMGPPDPSQIVFGKGWEDADIVASFSAAPGRAIPDELIERHRDSLASLTPTGLQWLLPHYMLYSVKRPDTEVADYVIYHLAGVKDDQYWSERLAVFTRAQKDAICGYLKFLLESGGNDNVADLNEAISKWCS